MLDGSGTAAVPAPRARLLSPPSDELLVDKPLPAIKLDPLTGSGELLPRAAKLPASGFPDASESVIVTVAGLNASPPITKEPWIMWLAVKSAGNPSNESSTVVVPVPSIPP